MKRYLPFIIVAAIALLTLGSAMTLYRAKLPISPATEKTADAPSDGAESLHARGPANAPVTVEEFGDFQCPPCAALAAPMSQLEQDYHSRLRFVFRQFPLAMHPHAREAALAAEAAGMQGRFWEMHVLLYREQPVWSKSADTRQLFESYAGMIGLNIERFKTDSASPVAKERIVADQKRAATLSVTNTPSVFVNGRALSGPALNPAGIRKAVDEALNAKPAGS